MDASRAKVGASPTQGTMVSQALLHAPRYGPVPEASSKLWLTNRIAQFVPGAVMSMIMFLALEMPLVSNAMASMEQAIKSWL